MPVAASKRTRGLEYAIRDVIEQAKLLEKRGRKVTYLNVGDPVRFDFPTPPHIKKALVNAIETNWNYYAPSEGLPELRQAIAEKEKKVNGVGIEAEDVLVTQGLSEAIHFIAAALVDPGDEVLVPGPSYPPYISQIKFFDGIPVTYRTVEDRSWTPDLIDLERKITSKTKAIVVNNPNNPSGAVYDESTLREIVNIASQHRLPIVSDEIYDRICFDRSAANVASFSNDIPVIGLNGFSKTYLMTGWRIGYIYFRDQGGQLKEIKECITKECRVRLSANLPGQKAAVEALRGPQDHIKEMVAKLRTRRDLVWKRINQIQGLSCSKPEGAFYVFPLVRGAGSVWKNDIEFANDLLQETGVLVVHGSGFDQNSGAGHFRAVILPPEAELQAALNEMESFMSKRMA